MIVRYWNLYSDDTWIGLAIGRDENEAIAYAKCFLSNTLKQHETLSAKPFEINDPYMRIDRKENDI